MEQAGNCKLLMTNLEHDEQRYSLDRILEEADHYLALAHYCSILVLQDLYVQVHRLLALRYHCLLPIPLTCHLVYCLLMVRLAEYQLVVDNGHNYLKYLGTPLDISDTFPARQI